MPPSKRKRQKINESVQPKLKRPSYPPIRNRRSTIDNYCYQKTIYKTRDVMVFSAKDNDTDELVAIKAQHHEGKGDLPPEVIYHSEASGRHPRIVKLREVILEHGAVYMIMEYLEHDLRSLMVQRFSEERVRTIMRQLLQDLAHIHSMGILHRDISPENILVAPKGAIKITDFGLACRFGGAYPAGKIPYCAPEMLLGGLEYRTSVDIWSTGCIMYDLLFDDPLFHGDNEFDQLYCIFSSLGMPDPKEWPEFYELQMVRDGTFDLDGIRIDKKGLRDIVPNTVLSDKGFDMLSRLLTTNPQCRITADAALSHSWFED